MKSARELREELRAIRARVARLEAAISTTSSITRTLSTGQAAQILGIGKSRMNRLSAEEQLGDKVGRRWRLDSAKVQALKVRRGG